MPTLIEQFEEIHRDATEFLEHAHSQARRLIRHGHKLRERRRRALRLGRSTRAIDAALADADARAERMSRLIAEVIDLHRRACDNMARAIQLGLENMPADPSPGPAAN